MAYGKRKVTVEYRDVTKDAAAMKEFLELSRGDRRVPLIDEAGTLTVGFGGS